MDVLLDEVESLEAILMDDVKIVKDAETGFPELIETVVLPTVGEDIDQQYVCITLQVMPTAGYPDVKPNYRLRNPRGLDDNGIERIRASVEQKLVEALGSPVVFDLIDVIREHLTDSNLPSGQCVVCLYGFQDGDEFTKTECYHYLHSYCLARHLDASKKNYQEEQDKLPAWQRKTSNPFQAFCPVCRELVSDNVDPIHNALPPLELRNAPAFQLTNELKDLQARMANLFLHQKNLGGIIDLNSEESNVISIDSEENMEAQARKKNSSTTNNCNGTSSITKSETDNSISSSASSGGSSILLNNQTNGSANSSRQDKKASSGCNTKNSSLPLANTADSGNKPDSDDEDTDDAEKSSVSNYHRGKNRHRRYHQQGRHDHGNRRLRQIAKHCSSSEQSNQACTSGNKR